MSRKLFICAVRRVSVMSNKEIAKRGVQEALNRGVRRVTVIGDGTFVVVYGADEVEGVNHEDVGLDAEFYVNGEPCDTKTAVKDVSGLYYTDHNELFVVGEVFEPEYKYVETLSGVHKVEVDE